MFSPLKIVAAAALAASALALPTQAIAVPLTSDLVVGVLTYHLTSCSSGASAGNTAPSCANVDWIANGPLGLTIEQSLGASPLEVASVKSDSSNAFNSFADLTITFSVTSSVANYLTGINLALDSAGDLSSFSDTVNAVGGSAVTAGATSNTRATVTGSKVFTSPITTSTITADIKASSTAANGTIFSVSQTFTAVPEPASMAILGAGVASLAALRRRTKPV